ncbi:hypothetical protein Ae406Ps2_6394c [Pseudonocardia sp. Ae406_Ps2]|nr:hypothetical protein Ae406Ps2_6394c [Pseudonocardia sp. Ae406_Ps2]
MPRQGPGGLAQGSGAGGDGLGRRSVQVRRAHDLGFVSGADEVADAFVLLCEGGGPDPVLVGRGAEDHVVLGLAHDPQAEPGPDVRADPGGQRLGVRALCGEDEDDPHRRAALDDPGREAVGFVLEVGVGEQLLALVQAQDDREQAQVTAGRQLWGDLVLRAQLPGQFADALGAAVEFGVDLAQRLHGLFEGGVVGAGGVAVRAPLHGREVSGALQLEDPQLCGRVERAGQQQHPQGEGLPEPRHRADQDVGEHQQDRDRPAALVGPERHRLEQVYLAVRGERPRARLGLAHVLVADPQHETAGVGVVGGFGPHAPQGAPQAGGEPVAALDDVGDRHPER